MNKKIYKKNIFKYLLILLILIGITSLTSIHSQDEEFKTIDDIFNLKEMYLLNDSYMSHNASSYDMDGGNDDGYFFEKHDYIKYETTILDNCGPGVITKIWICGYAADAEKLTFKIYVDGELLIDVDYIPFFNGAYKPFIKPYVGSGSDVGGGVYCFVPIVYNESVKITGKYINYYSIDYTDLPQDWNVKSTVITENPVLPKWMEEDFKIEDLSSDVYQKSLETSSEEVIYEDDQKGVVSGLNIKFKDFEKTTLTLTPMVFSGRSIGTTGEINFQADINPQNEGLYYKWRLDAVFPNQEYDLYVDNNFVCRVKSESGEEKRIKDITVQIPKKFTKNKYQINITIKNATSGGIDVNFSDIWLFSIINQETILSDHLKFLDSSSESIHNFSIKNETWSGINNVNQTEKNMVPDLEKYEFVNSKENNEIYDFYITNNNLDINIKSREDTDLLITMLTATKEKQSFYVYVNDSLVGFWNIEASNEIKEANYLINKKFVTASEIKLTLRPMSSYLSCSYIKSFALENDEYQELDNINAKDMNQMSVDFSSTKTNVNTIEDEWIEFLKNIEDKPDVMDILLNTNLQIFYNNEEIPSFDLPLSAVLLSGSYNFFQTKSLTQGIYDDGTMYFYLPIAYDNGVKIVLSRSNSNVTYHVDTKTAYNELDDDITSILYLKSQTHEYSPTVYGEPLVWLEANGSGKLVGLQLNMEGSSSYEYLEGDEKIYIDGNNSTQIYGTGTEDIFCGAWYFVSGTYTQDYIGCTTRELINNNRSHTAAYRMYITEAINFRNSIYATIEHGPINNTVNDNTSVYALYYHNEKEVMSLLKEIKNNEIVTLKEPVSKQVSGRYEGDYAGVYVNKEAHTLENNNYSLITLEGNISKSLLIRRFYNITNINQKAKVYVNDKFVGIWKNTYIRANEGIVRADDFIIPSSYLDGKKNITIRIEAFDEMIFEESDYEIYIFNTNSNNDDYDQDGIINSNDPYIQIKSQYIKAYTEYQNIPSDLKVIVNMPSLSKEELEEIKSYIGKDYNIESIININFNQNITFTNYITVEINTNIEANKVAVIYKKDGYYQLIVATNEKGSITFKVGEGGNYVIIG